MTLHFEGMVNLPDVNNSESAELLSDRVNDSYNALRKRIEVETDWDYLSILGDSWRTMNHTPRPGQGRISWHVCGRAVDIDQARRNAMVGTDLYGLVQRVKQLEKELAQLKQEKAPA